MTTVKDNSKPRVIAIIPAFNEEKYIGTVVLKARRHVDEVIVADDGSKDQTAIVARLAGATVIRQERNKGYGASIQTLFAEAKKREPDIVVLLDADSQHNPDEIDTLIEPISEGFDFVIGSRQQQQHGVPVYRRIGIGVISKFCHFLSGKKVADSECGFRAFSKKAIDKLELKENGMSISAETIAEAARKGLRITQRPISISYTGDGSTLNPISHGFGVLGRIVSMISERKPLLFFGLIGVVLAPVGFLAGFRVLDTAYSGGGLAIGTALVAVLLITIGILCIFTGIILHVITRQRV